jgi:hypothetical protein
MSTDRRGRSLTNRLIAVPPLRANISSRPTIGSRRSRRGYLLAIEVGAHVSLTGACVGTVIR